MNFRQQGRYPFRLIYQLMGVLLLVSVGPLFFSSRKLMGINQTALEDIILNLHTQAAVRLKGSVEMFLKNVQVSLTELARVQGMSDVLGATQRQGLLMNFLSSSDAVAGIKVTAPDGAETLSASRDRSMEAAFSELAGVRKGLADDAVTSGVAIGQPISVAGYDSALLPVAVPIHSTRGENLGVLTALVDLGEVQKMVAATRIGRHGSAFLVDRTGRVIAHQDSRKVKERTDLTNLEIVGNYILGGRPTGGTVPFLDENRQEMLGAYDLVEGVRWGVVVEEPKREAYYSLNEMRRQTYIWAVLAALAAMVLAAVFSHRISRPIRTFAHRALAVSRGEFRHTIEVKSRNEIGQLAETFNFMMKELDIYDRNMRELFLSTIKSLAAAVDAKDPYTRGHSDRVTQYSLAVGRELKLEERDLENLQIAALLHDVGKIGIDDSILRKPGRLSEEEYAIMKMHPVFGANIMGPIKQLREIIPGMKYHHECFNGSGYPEGLRKDEIPLASRIIAVADSFDAMTSNRPYQKAMNDPAVITILLRLSGVRYDPAVVQAFVAAYPSLGRQRLEDLAAQLTAPAPVAQEA